MFLLECDGCRTTATVQCACPPEMTGVNAHIAACSMTDLGAQLTCPPGSGCCDGTSHSGLSHDQAAMSCPGGHTGVACPETDTCRGWASYTAETRHPQYAGPAPGPCPGGHCHKDVPGCRVCRPITITFLGPTEIQAVS